MSLSSPNTFCYLVGQGLAPVQYDRCIRFCALLTMVCMPAAKNIFEMLILILSCFELAELKCVLQWVAAIANGEKYDEIVL